MAARRNDQSNSWPSDDELSRDCGCFAVHMMLPHIQFSLERRRPECPALIVYRQISSPCKIRKTFKLHLRIANQSLLEHGWTLNFATLHSFGLNRKANGLRFRVVYLVNCQVQLSLSLLAVFLLTLKKPTA